MIAILAAVVVLSTVACVGHWWHLRLTDQKRQIAQLKPLTNGRKSAALRK